MLIIADKRMPARARNKLAGYGEVVPFETRGITYEAISGHPDIFLCRVNGKLVAAPNIPSHYLDILEKRNVNYILGELPVGATYPETAKYNVVGTDKYLFHNFRYTDSTITGTAGDLDLIHINQGYARCNLVPLKNDLFITSDEGVNRVLVNNDLESLLVSPEGILLPGFKNGFIGGTTGILDDAIFFIGNLDSFPDGKKVRDFLSGTGHQLIELYEGPLYDGGSILFIRDED